MAYSTLAGLTASFGIEELLQLSDRDNIGAIDEAVVNKAIASADAEIDGYLSAGGYAVPLAPVQPLVVDLAEALVRYRLYKDHPTEVVNTRAKEARQILRKLALGEMSLVVAGHSASAGNAESEAPERVFTSETLRDF